MIKALATLQVHRSSGDGQPLELLVILWDFNMWFTQGRGVSQL